MPILSEYPDDTTVALRPVRTKNIVRLDSRWAYSSVHSPTRPERIEGLCGQHFSGTQVDPRRAKHHHLLTVSLFPLFWSYIQPCVVKYLSKHSSFLFLPHFTLVSQLLYLQFCARGKALHHILAESLSLAERSSASCAITASRIQPWWEDPAGRKAASTAGGERRG